MYKFNIAQMSPPPRTPTQSGAVHVAWIWHDAPWAKNERRYKECQPTSLPMLLSSLGLAVVDLCVPGCADG